MSDLSIGYAAVLEQFVPMEAGEHTPIDVTLTEGGQ